MARVAQAGPRPSGPGMISTILFLVLSLMLIGGYVPLYLEFAKASDARSTLIQLIKTQVEEPLKEKDIVLRTQPAAENQGVPYGVDFMKDLRDGVEKGALFDKWFPLIGWPRESGAKEIDDLLKSSTPAQPNLRALIEEQKRRITEEEERKKALQASLNDANAKREAAEANQKKLQDELAAMVKKKEEEQNQATASLRRDVERYKQESDQMKKLRQEAWNELEKEKAAHRKDVEEAQKEIEALKRRIATLDAELTKRFKTPVKVSYANILRTDPVNQIAVLDRGRLDGIGEGEKFIIFRTGKGGAKIQKGEVQVVRVDELVSVADVLSQDSMDPIVPGDQAERQKKFESPQ